MKEYYQMSRTEAQKAVNGSTQPLTEEQVKQNQEKYGPNALAEGKKKTVPQIFLEQYKDFLVIILIIAAIVSGILGETESAIVILIVITINAILGTVQTVKAEQSLNSLKAMSAPEAKVVRGGDVIKIPSSQVTMGDIVMLEAGDYVPADGRILENASLKVDESALTGESLAVEKMEDAIEGEVRFIRAFHYFTLVKRLGGVPLITEVQEYNEDTDKTEYLQKLTNVYIKAFGIINPIDSKKINGLKQQNWYPIRDRSENEFWIYKDLKSIEDIRTNINHLSHTIKVSYRSFIKNRVIQQKTFNPAYDKKNALISLKKDLDVRKYGGYANAEYGFMSLLKQKNKYLLFPISNLSISKEIKSDEKLLKDFIAKEYGKKCEVVVPVIPWNVLLRQNGSLYTLSGKSGNNIYAQSFYEFILSPEKYDILRKVINVYDKVKLEIKAEAKKNKDKKDNFSNKLKDLYEVVDDSIVVLSKDDEGKPRKKFSTSDLDVLYDEYQAKLSSEQFRKMNTNVNVKKISDRFLNPGNKFKFQNAELADKIQFIYQVSKVCTSMYKKETTFEKCGDIDGFFLSKPYISSNLSDGFEIYKLSVTGLKKFVYFKDSNE